MNELDSMPQAAAQGFPGSNAMGAYAGNTSANALVAREQGESLVSYSVAHRWPRDVLAKRAAITNAFSRPRLAEVASYEYAKGGSEVKGPSIRAAEALAQYWGNVGHGYQVLSESLGADGVPVSEVRAYAVDYESTNTAEIRFPVRHWRATKRGGYALKDDREVYELVANMAARRKRACILAVIPQDVVDDAMDQAETTLRSKADTSADAMARMVEAFAPFGVTREQIEKRIQRKLDSISAAQVVSLKRIYASLRDGMSTPAQWFDTAADESAGGGGADSLATVRGVLADPSAPPPPAPPTTPPAPPQRTRNRREAAPTPAPSPIAPPAMPDGEGDLYAGEEVRPGPLAIARRYANENGTPDAAAMLAYIRAATDLRDLDGMDEAITHYQAADRPLLVEATMQRERVLAAHLAARTGTNDNER